MLLSLLSKLKGYAVAVGLFLITTAIAVAYAFGRRDGEHIAHDKIKDDLIEDVKTKNEITNDVSGLSDDALDERLSKWTRE